jgi:hypothetical protein
LLLNFSVLNSLLAFLAHQSPPSEHQSYSSSRCYIVLVASLAIVSPVPCHFCTGGHLSRCDGQFFTFLQAAADFLRDPLFPRVWRCSAA